jgi:hypothetical protein
MRETINTQLTVSFAWKGEGTFGSGLRSKTCRRRPPLPGRRGHSRRGTAVVVGAEPSATIAVTPRMFLAAETAVVHAAAVGAARVGSCKILQNIIFAKNPVFAYLTKNLL